MKIFYPEANYQHHPKFQIFEEGSRFPFLILQVACKKYLRLLRIQVGRDPPSR